MKQIMSIRNSFSSNQDNVLRCITLIRTTVLVNIGIGALTASYFAEMLLVFRLGLVV